MKPLGPTAAAWAVRYARNPSISERVFRRQTAPTVARCAAQGIAYACTNDADSLLYDLLVGAIDDCKTPERTRHTARDDQDVTIPSPSAAMSGQVTA